MKDFSEDNAGAGFIGAMADQIGRAVAPHMPPAGLFGRPVVIGPTDWKVHELPWSEEHPQRTRQKIRLDTRQSFAEYVSRFKTSATIILGECEPPEVSFLAALDYHEPGSPAWVEHTAKFTPVQTSNWKIWMAMNKQGMSQITFAQFIEDNASDIVSPVGADLLRIINEFEVDGAIKFSKVQRLQDGAIRFFYTSDQTAKAGELSVPDKFLLSIPVFEGEEKMELAARLRWRLNNGDLKIWFHLVQPDEVFRASFHSLVEEIKEGTGIAPLMGELP